MRKIAVLWVTVLCLWTLGLPPSSILAAGHIAWGPVQKVTYDKLPDSILAYKNELYAGGLQLKTSKVVPASGDPDLVINQYGDMGALVIAELAGEGLSDPTEESAVGSGTSVRIKKGTAYLIVLHDGSRAKVVVDSLSSNRAMLSYVLEAGSAAPQPTPTPQPAPKPTPNPSPSPLPTPTPQPIPTPSPTPMPQPTPASGPGELDAYQAEEGSVVIEQDVQLGDTGWDLYRADNGGKLVRMNDFRLSSPKYDDKYALTGHTYLYQWQIFNSQGKNIAESGVIQVSVKAKGTLSNAISSVIRLQLDNTTAEVNGQVVTLETPPTLIGGRTMVPLRFIAEALGAVPKWDGGERKITLDMNGSQIVLWIDEAEAKVNGRTEFMDVPAQIVNDTTLVPVRFISEHFQQDITFDNATGTITIRKR